MRLRIIQAVLARENLLKLCGDALHFFDSLAVAHVSTRNGDVEVFGTKLVKKGNVCACFTFYVLVFSLASRKFFIDAIAHYFVRMHHCEDDPCDSHNYEYEI